MALRRLALPPLFLVLLWAPARAHAALPFSPCPHKPGVQCATLTVPIDRSGAVPGTFSLHVERVRGYGRVHRVLFGFNGGPGQTNTKVTTAYAHRLHAALRTHDLYLFDQRGTGSSGAIHCLGVENGEPPAQAVPACASLLGLARNFYTTLASVQDTESLRHAIGAPRIAIFGVSYGTYLAQAYAGLHPGRVESLLFDSPVAPSGNADPFGLRQFRALPGVLRSICARGQCRGILPRFQQAAYALLARLGSHPEPATYYDAQGNAHRITLTELGLAAQLQNIDLQPNLRAELPRAVAAALHGDLAPVARLAAGGSAGTPAGKPDAVNPTLNLVTLCEERDLGFSRSATPDQRIAQGRALLARSPASAFTPFTPDIAFAISLVPSCAYWPSLPQPPLLPSGSLPAVPALLLQGESDLRTPPSSAREAAARLPKARVLTVPFVGHAVIQGDDTGCALRAVSDFYAGRRVRACRGSCNPYPPRPLVPARLGAAPPAAGIPGQAGRAVQAVRLTVEDALQHADPGIYGDDGLRTGGGLRGGSYAASSRGVRLDADVFVPGVAVSGFVPVHGTARLRLGGSVRGALAFEQDGRVTGTVDGDAVHGRAPLLRHTVAKLLARKRAERVATHGRLDVP